MYDIRVVIVEPDDNKSKKLKDQLSATGHIVVAETSDGRKGMRHIFQTTPDIVLISGAMGLETIKTIEEHRIAPILIIDPDLDLLDQLRTALISGWVTTDMNDLLLEATVQIAINNFKRQCQLEHEIKELKRTIEERKIIEQAKGLLMEKRGYSERKAFQYMRKLSMDKCVPMIRVAKAVIKSLHDQIP